MKLVKKISSRINGRLKNKIAMTKCIVAGAAVVVAGAFAFALITDPVYDVIIDNDHGHFQAMISANN